VKLAIAALVAAAAIGCAFAQDKAPAKAACAPPPKDLVVKDLEAGGLRHSQVEQSHIERFAFDNLESLGPIRNSYDIVSVVTEEPCELVSQGRVIIGD